jgi:hypothetical protein
MNATKPDREFEASLFAHLSDVRDRVCGLCGGKPIGDPRGNPCGAGLPLERLVEALNETEPRREGLPPCSANTAVHTHACPLPRKRLAILAALAAEDVEEERQGREHSSELLCKGDEP